MSQASQMSQRKRAGPKSVAPSKTQLLTQLQGQLAQLTEHMSDLERQVQITAVHADCMRSLGGYSAAMLMAASKILGEEAISHTDSAEIEK